MMMFVVFLVFGFEGLGMGCGMGYNLCLFDLDGTLADSKEGIINSIKYASYSLGFALPDDAVLSRFLGPPLRESFIEFCGMTSDEAEVAVAKYREYFVEKGMFENELYAGIPVWQYFRT